MSGPATVDWVRFRPADPVKVNTLATAWLQLSGDGRLPMVAYVGLYRVLNAGRYVSPFVVQSIIAGNGKTVRQGRMAYPTLKAATRHFRNLTRFLARERAWAMRILGEPRIKTTS